MTYTIAILTISGILILVEANPNCIQLIGLSGMNAGANLASNKALASAGVKAITTAINNLSSISVVSFQMFTTETQPSDYTTSNRLVDF